MKERRMCKRKGVSTVIGGAIFLIIVLLGLNIMVWMIGEFDTYGRTVNDRTRLEWERINERVTIAAITVRNNKANITLINNGALTSRLVRVWITEYSTMLTPNWHQVFELNRYINPGETMFWAGEEATVSLDPSLVYSFRMVTERGNVVSRTYAPLAPITGAGPGFQNIGFLTISFTQPSFQYTSASQATPIQAWDVAAGQNNIIWHVEITNHGASEIKIFRFSAMSVVQITGTQASMQQQRHYIVAPTTPNQGPLVAYSDISPQTLPANSEGDFSTGGTPAVMKFAADSPGGTSYPGTNQYSANTEWMVFITIFFEYQSAKYTQVLPFAGVHFKA